MYSLQIDFFFANSADPDEMLHSAAFHLGFTVCQSTLLPKVLIAYILSKKSNGPRNSTMSKNFVSKFKINNTYHTVQQPLPDERQYFSNIYL